MANIKMTKDKPLIKRIKAMIDDCADQTDIWDNERWDKTKRLLFRGFMNLNKEAVEKLLEDVFKDDSINYRNALNFLSKVRKHLGEFK